MKFISKCREIILVVFITLVLSALGMTTVYAAPTLQEDVTSPETVLDSTPTDPSNAGVTFTFSSGDPTATFACQMDSGEWSDCASPYTTIVMTAGEHTFQVRANRSHG
jgi:hypothetical protein